MKNGYIKQASLKYKGGKVRANAIIIITSLFVIGLLFSLLSFVFSTGIFNANKKNIENESSMTNLTEPEIKENILMGLQNKIQDINIKLGQLTGDKSSELSNNFGENYTKINSKVDIQAKIIDAYEFQRNEEYKKLKDKLNKSNQKLEQLEKKYSSFKTKINLPLLPPPPLLNSKKAMTSSRNNLRNKNTTTSSNSLPPNINDSFFNEYVEKELNNVEEVVELKTFHITTLENEIEEESNNNENNSEDEVKKVVKTYDIALGFGKGYMITGAYGPLFGSSPLGDVPVLIEAQKSILIPNDYTEDIDKCFLIGGGLGDPATNSVLIRLTDIQCIFANKKKQIRGSITGWVLGKDGKPGVKGKLISKSGQYIWRSMMTGAMQGFASSTSKELPLVFSSKSGNGLGSILSGTGSGASRGMSGAFEKIADFYLKMAEKTLPVIEVQGGQTVNLFLKGGEKLKVEDFNSIDVPLLDEYYSKEKEEEL